MRVDVADFLMPSSHKIIPFSEICTLKYLYRITTDGISNGYAEY